MMGKAGLEPATQATRRRPAPTFAHHFPEMPSFRAAKRFPLVYGAENRDRTGTILSYQRILSPWRLPIPPSRRSHINYRTRILKFK